MKKLFIIILCMFAWNCNPVYADGNQMELQMGIIDDVPMTPGHSKAPMRMPRIYQDGYMLTLSSSHPEYIINIVGGEDVVFSSIISEGLVTYELPSYLSGEYTIQFISGRFCFYCLINL